MKTKQGSGRAPAAAVADLEAPVMWPSKRGFITKADEDSDRPAWTGGNRDLNPHRPNDGGKPDHAGTQKGSLYGDQMVLLRDLDPTNDDVRDGNGEPVLDENGNPIVVGSNGKPIYFVAEDSTVPLDETDWVIPENELPYVQEVELGRANVARAPAKVMQKALNEALTKIAEATDGDDTDSFTFDLAGRLVCNGATIDSPLENLALYRHLMTADADSLPDWVETVTNWGGVFTGLVGQGWSPASLLGAAWDKAGEITLDAMLYENTTLGINDFNAATEETTYFSFNRVKADGTVVEAFDYDRADQFAGVTVKWYELDANNVPQSQGPMSLLEAVFGGQDWDDTYMVTSADGARFIPADASGSGTNDFAQAADDARAVIAFMHDAIGLQIIPAGTDGLFIG